MFIGNFVLGTTGIDFMAILQYLYIDYSKFKRFSNIADEISAKLLSSFLEYEMMVVVTDQYDFEFSVKTDERKPRTEASAHLQEVEIVDNQNVHSHFKVTLQ